MNRPWAHLLLAAILALTAGAGCNARPQVETARADCCAGALPAAAFTDNSLYQVESTWTTDAATAMPLGNLRGRVQVVVMFFTSCAYACPIIVNNLKRLEATLPPTLRPQTGFVLVSFDAGRDTPPVLKAFRQKYELDARRWTLLRGEPQDVLELAALLGVKYKRDANGNFAHSNLITVLNPEGEIIHQQAGLHPDVAVTVNAMQQALAVLPPPPPPANR